MPLETGTQIGQLDPANPPGTDPVSQADDHLRLIKECVQGSLGEMLEIWGIPTNDLPLKGLNAAGDAYIDMIKVDATDAVYLAPAGGPTEVGGDLAVIRHIKPTGTAIVPTWDTNMYVWSQSGYGARFDGYQMQFDTGASRTTALTIDFNQDVSIPNGDLDVDGATTLNALTTIIGPAGNGNPALLISPDNAAGINFVVQRDASGSGTLDIGTSTNHNVDIIANGVTVMTATPAGDATFADDVRVNGLFRYADMSEVTIAAGAVTVTQNLHYIDTEGDAATDDLNTINGGVEGMMLICRVAVGGRDVVFKNGTGNIFMGDSADVTLSTTADNIMLCYYAGSWHVLSSLV